MGDSCRWRASQSEWVRGDGKVAGWAPGVPCARPGCGLHGVVTLCTFIKLCTFLCEVRS